MEISETSLSLSDGNNPYKRITRRIDYMRIKSGQKRELDVTTCSTKDLHIRKDIAVRAGAIIYTHHKGETYFCLGIDTHSGNITDFGGGVKKDETIVEGGLRELEEESQGVFGTLTPEDVAESTTFHCFNMAIMFIPTCVDPDRISRQFKRRMTKYKKLNPDVEPEVCNIIWLSKQEMLESIHGRGNRLYVRVRRLLSKVTNVIKDM